MNAAAFVLKMSSGICVACTYSDGVPPVVPPNADIEMTVEVLEHEGVSYILYESNVAAIDAQRCSSTSVWLPDTASRQR